MAQEIVATGLAVSIELPLEEAGQTFPHPPPSGRKSMRLQQTTKCFKLEKVIRLLQEIYGQSAQGPKLLLLTIIKNKTYQKYIRSSFALSVVVLLIHVPLMRRVFGFILCVHTVVVKLTLRNLRLQKQHFGGGGSWGIVISLILYLYSTYSD